jgi:hypothetical protein
MSKMDELFLEYGEVWDAFVSWAKNNGCWSDSEEDWSPWWECYLAGREKKTE